MSHGGMVREYKAESDVAAAGVLYVDVLISRFPRVTNECGRHVGAEVEGGTPTGPIAPDEPAVQDEQVFEDTAQDDEPGDQNDFG